MYLRALSLCICAAIYSVVQAADVPGADAAALKADLEKITGGRFSVTSAGVVGIVSDAPEAIAEMCAKHIDEVVPLQRVLAQFPKSVPPLGSVQVALFAKYKDFETFTVERRGACPGTFTYLHHDVPGKRVIAAFVLPAVPLLTRLRHAVSDAMLRACITHPPRWLQTGLGECMEHAALDPTGKPAFGYARAHLRDYRERVLAGEPPTKLAIKDLIALSGDEVDKKGLGAGLQAWALVRYMLDERLAREAKLFPRLLTKLDPHADEAKNTQIANDFFVEEEWEFFEKSLHRYIENLPESAAEKTWDKAQELLKQRAWPEAQKYLEAAVKADPGYERLHYHLALARYKQGLHGEALAPLDKGLQIFPEYNAARFLRARVRALLNERDGARRDYELLLPTSYGDYARQELETLGK